MKTLTPQEREALMVDMRSIFEEGLVDETLSDEEMSNDPLRNLGHGWSSDMPR